MPRDDDPSKKTLRDNTHHDPKPDDQSRSRSAPRGMVGYGPPALVPGGSMPRGQATRRAPGSPDGPSRPEESAPRPGGPRPDPLHLLGAAGAELKGRAPVAPEKVASWSEAAEMARDIQKRQHAKRTRQRERDDEIEL